MSKINSTSVLLYADGQVIAIQRSLDLDINQDLYDLTNKESGGWAEHGNGLRSVTVNLDSLFSTTGVTGGELIAYITGRTSLFMEIKGGVAYPLIGEVDVASVKLTAPVEGGKTVSGSLKVKGPLYHLKGTSAQLMTDPDANGTDYDTLTISGTAITSAINLAGAAHSDSNTLNTSSGDVYKFACFLTLNSGELPTVGIWDNTSAYISNTQQLTAGVNIVTLTATGTDASSSLRISNTAAANFTLSTIYLFKA